MMVLMSMKQKAKAPPVLLGKEKEFYTIGVLS
jgi:hypothetical protein